MKVFDVIDIIGVVSFAISGFLIAYKHKLDIFGIVLSSFLTALGGGIIRDVIVGKLPLVFTNFMLPTAVLCAILLSFIFKLYQKKDIDRKKIFIFSDAIGLVSFSISGSLVAIDCGINFFGVAILSFVTAVGGGLIRDVLINHIPLVLSKDFYATITIIIAFIIFLLDKVSLLNDVTIFCIFIFALFIRWIAIVKKWNLPRLKI